MVNVEGKQYRSSPKRSKGRPQKSTKTGRNGDDSLELLVHGALAVTTHNHLLITQLLCNITWSGPRNFYPCRGKHCARDEDKGNVDEEVQRVVEYLRKVVRRGDVVGDAAGCNELAGPLIWLPNTDSFTRKLLGNLL